MLDRTRAETPNGARSHPSPLNLNEGQFRQLLDRLPTGAYTCDPAGLITYYNQHAVNVWGREPALNDPLDRF